MEARDRRTCAHGTPVGGWAVTRAVPSGSVHERVIGSCNASGGVHGQSHGRVLIGRPWAVFMDRPWAGAHGPPVRDAHGTPVSSVYGRLTSVP